MLLEVRKKLAQAEGARPHNQQSAVRELGDLCLDDFAEVLLNMPDQSVPHLSSLLPRMASEEVQKNWTGASGYVLLRQSLTFVRTVWHNYERLTGKTLRGSTILDYGCGYGRILRLMMYFTELEKLHGCDPWQKSIDICKEDGIACRLAVTEYLPTELPYQKRSFDLIYAFSVFTHTSPRASAAAMSALAKVTKPDGLLVITIRPPDYWDFDQAVPPHEREMLKKQHCENGIAFRPHRILAIDGDITYGDTSMSLDHIKRTFTDWTIVGEERTLDDPYQSIIYLQSRKQL